MINEKINAYQKIKFSQNKTMQIDGIVNRNGNNDFSLLLTSLLFRLSNFTLLYAFESIFWTISIYIGTIYIECLNTANRK